MIDHKTTLLVATALLDYNNPEIQALIKNKGWMTLNPYQRIGQIYDFVRDDIQFGYNEDDTLPASKVLADGIGQCNTKATLFMALLRASGIACRFHDIGCAVRRRGMGRVVAAVHGREVPGGNAFDFLARNEARVGIGFGGCHIGCFRRRLLLRRRP